MASNCACGGKKFPGPCTYLQTWWLYHYALLPALISLSGQPFPASTNHQDMARPKTFHLTPVLIGQSLTQLHKSQLNGEEAGVQPMYH